MEINRMVSMCYEKFYANKLDSLDNMDKFLEKHKLPSMSQEKKIWTLANKDIALEIKNKLSINKILGSDGFRVELYDTFFSVLKENPNPGQTPSEKRGRNTSQIIL